MLGIKESLESSMSSPTSVVTAEARNALELLCIQDEQTPLQLSDGGLLIDYISINKALTFDLNHISCVISPFLVNIDISENIGIEGDISMFITAPHLISVKMNKTSVSGDISVFGNCPNLQILGAYKTKVIQP